MKRTLQTAVIGFRPLLEKGMTILAWPDLRDLWTIGRPSNVNMILISIIGKILFNIKNIDDDEEFDRQFEITEGVDRTRNRNSRAD